MPADSNAAAEDPNDIVLVIGRTLQDYGADRRLHAVLCRARSTIIGLRANETAPAVTGKTSNQERPHL